MAGQRILIAVWNSFWMGQIRQAVVVLFGVLCLVFFLFHVVGGDPVYQMVGQHAHPQTVAEIRKEYGFDLPLYKQFLHFFGDVLRLDFGHSYATRRDIGAMVVEGLWPSVLLALPAFLGSIGLGFGLAVAAVIQHRKKWDRAILLLCVFAMSIPSLAYILVGQYFFAFRWGVFPISGFEFTFPQAIGFVILPALIWVLMAFGGDARFFRTTLLEEMRQEYVRTARAKGLAERRVLLRHVFKNAWVPILTHVVLQIPFLILGSFLLESFFGIPGVGGLTIQAIHNSDLPVIRAMTLLNACLFLLGNVFTEVLCRRLDPRYKMGAG